MSALGRCRSHLRRHSLALQSSALGSPPRRTILFETTGPPARCGRDCLPVRRARPWSKTSAPSYPTKQNRRPWYALRGTSTCGCFQTVRL